MSRVLQRYKPSNVYNLDEIGLYWVLKPNHKLIFKDEECNGGKKSKNHITVLIGANMDGFEKLHLLVIGKSKRPRCFPKKLYSLPVLYEANSNAWMTADVFTEYVKQEDARLQKRSGRCFILDNCTAHPHLQRLRTITLYFFPPNTTAKLQPCDQGIIKNFKTLCRQMLLKCIVQGLDDGEQWNINLLDGLYLIRLAWQNVKCSTISNCFRHTGFYVSLENDQQPVPEPNESGKAKYSQICFC